METPRREEVDNFQCSPGNKGEPLRTAKPYTILLVDDHAMFRRGIKKIIEEAANLTVVGEAGDGLEALNLLRDFIPDLIILDISMPKCGGMEASREIKRLYPGLKVMILTLRREEEYMRCAMSVGVDGYLLKEDAADKLIEAIFTLRGDKNYFSPIRSECEFYEPMVRTHEPEIDWGNNYPININNPSAVAA